MVKLSRTIYKTIGDMIITSILLDSIPLAEQNHIPLESNKNIQLLFTKNLERNSYKTCPTLVHGVCRDT